MQHKISQAPDRPHAARRLMFIATLLLSGFVTLAACGSAEQAAQAPVEQESLAEPTKGQDEPEEAVNDDVAANEVFEDDTESATDEDNSAANEESVEVSTAILAVGDPERGREVFETGGGVLPRPCSDCHSLDGNEVLDFFEEPMAPSLLGISSLATERVPGMSAEEYIRSSIEDPKAYIVEGDYKSEMTIALRDILNDDDTNALVAFLLTQ